MVPLHTQWLAAIGRLKQLELQQDGLLQVSTDECLIAEDRDTDNWRVHYWMSRKPEGEKEQSHRVSVRQKVGFDVPVSKDKVARLHVLNSN